MTTTTEKAPALKDLFARLPRRIDGWKVLVVGGEAGLAAAFEARGAAEVALCAEPSEQLRADAGSFDLAYCAELESDLHPLSLYAWLWQVTAPGSLLLLEAAVLPDEASSQYARFDPAGGSPTGPRWVPGRLTLKWMVENSGFDVQGWLSDPPAAPGRCGVRLQAVRVERSPARDLDQHPLGR